MRRYRLMDRTPRFQCGNTGSIPVSGTNPNFVGGIRNPKSETNFNNQNCFEYLKI